jgi:hypothetical protein
MRCSIAILHWLLQVHLLADLPYMSVHRALVPAQAEKHHTYAHQHVRQIAMDNSRIDSDAMSETSACCWARASSHLHTV